MNVQQDCFLSFHILAKRLEQLEEFRLKKALEKSARTDRIKKRVQELHDKRRQTISLIRSELGINPGEKCNQDLPATKLLKKDLKRVKAGTFASVTKQGPVRVSEKIRAVAKPSNEKLGEAYKEKFSSTRRLTLTLSDSVVEATMADKAEESKVRNKVEIKASDVNYKVNKEVSQKPSVIKDSRERKVLEKKAPPEQMKILNDAKNLPTGKRENAGGNVPNINQKRKR